MAQTWRKHRRVLARPDSSDALGSVRVPEAPAIDGAQESIREIRKSRKISANMSSSFFGNHDANAFLNVSDTPEAPARLRLPRVEFSHRGSLVVQDVRVSRTLGKGVFADPDEEQAHSAEGGTDVKWDDALTARARGCDSRCCFFFFLPSESGCLGMARPTRCRPTSARACRSRRRAAESGRGDPQPRCLQTVTET